MKVLNRDHGNFRGYYDLEFKMKNGDRKNYQMAVFVEGFNSRTSDPIEFEVASGEKVSIKRADVKSYQYRAAALGRMR